jgi:hypothetical protein
MGFQIIASQAHPQSRFFNWMPPLGRFDPIATYKGEKPVELKKLGLDC